MQVCICFNLTFLLYCNQGYLYNIRNTEQSFKNSRGRTVFREILTELIKDNEWAKLQKPCDESELAKAENM